MASFRGRHQYPLRQGQGLSARRVRFPMGRAPPRKGRLRPGAWREVVAHEAAEALLPPHDEVGRADDGKITNQRNEHEKKHHRQSQW